jgi:predicted glycoside hydrolase/deacetylase ChbG (UPF0249 family)
VNRGILEAHAAGAVTSTSVIVNLPAFADAVRRARAAPGLGIGLHFNIVVGRPLTDALSLVDRRTGAFLSLPRLTGRALIGRVDPLDVERECGAQISRLRDAGLHLTHLDSHRHVHALPGVWRGVARAARTACVAVIRRPLEPFRLSAADPAAATKQLLIALSWAIATRVERPTRSLRFIGISLQGSRRLEARLVRLIARLPAGVTELMVHPGYDDPELETLDPYRGARERELAVLTSPALNRALSELERIRFDDL